MTYMLLRGGGFREGNPVAGFFFARWNIAGMVAFKFGMVAFVSVIAQWIARSRIETARWLLRVGTLAVTVVVLYSLTLYLKSFG